MINQRLLRLAQDYQLLFSRDFKSYADLVRAAVIISVKLLYYYYCPYYSHV